MFGQYLDGHSLYKLLKDEAFQPFPCMGDMAAWASLPEDIKATLVALADKYKEKPYPMRLATDFMAFVRNGSRKADENPYFFRRTKLIVAFLGCCVTNSDAYMDDVVNGLWCIFEETSWVISAHNGSSHDGMRPASERPLPDPGNPYVDLFSAQTAMIISFIFSIVGDELDTVTPLIRRRGLDEIRRRVLIPFMTRDDFWWMGMIRKDLCNWTPWIVSNVMVTACLNMTDKRALAELLDRGCRMLDRFLMVIPEDGGCDEGAAYWNMAGGALLDCLEVLEKVTGGEMTFWDNQKLRNIASFPARVRLDNGWFVNFADCDARPYICGERLQYAGERMDDAALKNLGIMLRRDPSYQLSDTPQLWRCLNELFHPVSEAKEEAIGKRNVWLPDLQVRIVENNGMILAAKGGHNAENHNHNDVGSFMLYVDGEPVIIDVGNMVYTAKTFSENRYELWNTRSRNHNVPLINGCEQCAGREHGATCVQYMEDGLQIEYAAAYPAGAGVATCNRKVYLDEQGMHLVDEIECGEDGAVSWTFMLRHKPNVENNRVTIGEVVMILPVNMLTEVEEIVVDDPRMAENYPGSVWRMSCHNSENVSKHVQFDVIRA